MSDTPQNIKTGKQSAGAGFTPLDSQNSNPKNRDRKTISVKSVEGSVLWSKNLTGFTLLEVVVSLALILAAVLGPVSLIIHGLINFSISENKLIATHLAHEGIELVRAIRENNKICERNGAAGWQWDRDYTGSGNIMGSGRVIDTTQNNSVSCASLTVQNSLMGGPGAIPLVGGDCYQTPLRIDSNGRYSYQAGGNLTSFVRCIDIVNPAAAESPIEGTIPSSQMLNIVSTVRWNERGTTKSMILRTRLYNWQ